MGRVALAAAILCAACTVGQAGEEKRRTVKIPNAQLEPTAFANLDGWAEDDHAAAFAAFMISCKPILRGTPAMRAARPVYGALYEACQQAVAAKPKDAKEAREFFEQNFKPVRITPLGDNAGFLTGYYEPIVDGAREPSGEFAHPLYRKPAGLLRGGRMLKAASFARKAAKDTKDAKQSSKPAKANKAAKGKTVRRGGKRLVSFYDRAAIEDGVLNGRNLEICYLKDPIDSFFIHIQGSARVRLAGGGMMRVNYEAQNGHAYTAVGKFLIERKIVSREEMSMDRIRQWMVANPEEAKELRRLNKSYVFFRETGLADNEEAIGAQGVSLTPGRSIAVDRNLHVYGTPFFIQSELPIDSEQPTTKFRRLMVAQDTGGAIVGPARADIYFGAGDEAGRISGRLKHPGRFVMLFPNGIDPFAAIREIPLPRPRPTNIPEDQNISGKKPDAIAAKPEAKPAEAKPPEANKAAALTAASKPKAKQAAKPKRPEAKASGTKPSPPKSSPPKSSNAKPPETKKPGATKKTETKKSTKPKPAT